MTVSSAMVGEVRRRKCMHALGFWLCVHVLLFACTPILLGFFTFCLDKQRGESVTVLVALPIFPNWIFAPHSQAAFV